MPEEDDMTPYIIAAALILAFFSGMVFMAMLVASKKPAPVTDELEERVRDEERQHAAERIAQRQCADGWRTHETKLERDVREAIAFAEAGR